MDFDRRVISNMPDDLTAGPYVETFAGHHIYGRSGCFACPELQLWGYMALHGIRRAIVRLSGGPEDEWRSFRLPRDRSK